MSSILLVMEAISETYRRHRLAHGLTQDQVAAAAGISRKTLSDFENGRSGITLANLQRLLRAVGLELTLRDASSRPTLDELSTRYAGQEPNKARRRARATKTT